MLNLLRILCLGAVLTLPFSLACVGTPLPDPPSARPEAMMLLQASASDVRLSGTMGAIRVMGAGTSLRVTIPSRSSRVVVPVDAAGAFSAELAGAVSDVLFLERVEASGDVFLIAVRGPTGAVMSAPAGADADGDRSPDAIDCAPADPMVGARACATCAGPMDCGDPMVFTCVAGACRPLCSMTEVCGNGLDDDCDGTADNGCGAPCMVDSDCGPMGTCPMGMCVAGAGELCGNGLDDDSDGLIDEGCGGACMIDLDCGGMDRCVMGMCTAGPGELCGNGLDDDGDGLIDEDCAATCMLDTDCGPMGRCAMGVCVP